MSLFVCLFWPSQFLDSFSQHEQECTTAVLEKFARTHGFMSLNVDGATILGKSSFVYTVSKGRISAFECITHHGSEVHVREAEVRDIKSKIKSLEAKYKCTFTILAGDNGERGVLARVIKELVEAEPEKRRGTLLFRDAGHCIDLPAKDCVTAPLLAAFFTETKNIIKLMKVDRVHAIVKDELYGKSKIPLMPPPAQIHPDTRFYLMHDQLSSTLGQKEAMTKLTECEAWTTFFDSRPANTQNSITETLSSADPRFWRKVKMLKAFFAAFKRANKEASKQNMPMSAYLPLLQALRNEVNRVLNMKSEANETWNQLFGAPVAAELANIVRCRFNLDGKPTGVAKVGLCDRFQIWAHMFDPYARDLKPGLYVDHSVELKACLNFFLKTETDAEKREWRECKRAAEAFFTGGVDGEVDWAAYFDFDPPANPPTRNDLLAGQRTLTFDNVAQWVNSTGGSSTRLSWWETHAKDTNLYQKVVKKLLSGRTEGSIQARVSCQAIEE